MKIFKLVTTIIIINCSCSCSCLNFNSNFNSNFNFNYQYDKRIHNLGNIGLGGKIHAYISPLFTNMIDKIAYNGRNIRKEVLNNYTKNKSVLDLCCGVGTSTPNNKDNPNSLGIDTSPQMIRRAKELFPNKNFELNDGEYFIPNPTNKKYDIATCFFGFHEMPTYAWKRIIKNIEPYINEKIIIVDISPTYSPSSTMLSGEPYLLEYQKNIQEHLIKLNFKENILIMNHVSIWQKEMK